MRTEFLCISVLRVASGPRVKLASCKSALSPPPPPPPRPGGLLYRPAPVDPVLVYEAICCMSFRVSFCSCVFQSI